MPPRQDLVLATVAELMLTFQLRKVGLKVDVYQREDSFWWTKFCGHEAFLGETLDQAWNTAHVGDLFIPSLDGELTADSRKDLGRPPGRAKVVNRAYRNAGLVQQIKSINSAAMRKACWEGECPIPQPDPGEPMEMDELVSHIAEERKSPTLQCKRIPLYRRYSKEGWFKKGNRKGGLFYQDTPGSSRPAGQSLRSTFTTAGLRAEEDGWFLFFGAERAWGPYPGEKNSKDSFVREVELTVENDTNRILDLRLFNPNGDRVLRLAVNDQGKLELHDLFLT